MARYERPNKTQRSNFHGAPLRDSIDARFLATVIALLTRSFTGTRIFVLLYVSRFPRHEFSSTIFILVTIIYIHYNYNYNYEYIRYIVFYETYRYSIEPYVPEKLHLSEDFFYSTNI